MTQRFHIDAISLNGPSQNFIRLKLLLDDQTLFHPPAMKKNQPLNWTDVSIDIGLNPASIIAVEIEKKTLLHGWSKLVTFKVSGAEVQQLFLGAHRELHISEKGYELLLEFTSIADKDLSVSTGDASGNGDLELDLESPQTDLNIAIKIVERQKGSLLEELGWARDNVKTILTIVDTVAEVHPFAKLASLALTAAFDHLQKEEINDTNLTDLAHDMAHTLTFVVVVQGRAKIEKLKWVVREMMELVRNASHFIVDYFSRGRLERAARGIFMSTVQDQITEFINSFEKLRNAMNSGVVVQVLDLFCNFEEDRRLDSLRRAIPTECRASYNPEHACMPGTRVDTLKEIINWVIDDNDDHLLWLRGLAGTGKSAIACSICHQLRESANGRRYLGASFFCKRDDKYLRNPTLILPKITVDLANSFPAFGKLVAAALTNDPELVTTEAITRQFTELIKGPFLKLSQSNRDPLVIVVDALDEMGTADDRMRLITTFYEISRLAPWLKIIFTSRPDPDIHRFFDQPERKFRDLDLNARRSDDDILTFTRARMRDVAESKELGSGWPGEDKILALAERGTPLFIWVEVATAFIKGSMEPDERLQRVLKANSSSTGYKPLDLLYTAAIEAFFGGEDEVDNAEVFRNVIGTIVAVSSHTPLPGQTLMAFMRHTDKSAGERPIDGRTFERAINALGSVLYKDVNNNAAIRICHPSFTDYLTKPDRLCPARFRIDICHENTRMAAFCLRTMLDGQHGLKFNICGLESSHCLNADIEGLSDRVKSTISEPLRYSSLHWAAHLAGSAVEGNGHTKIYMLLKQFFDKGRPLFWLEALSLLGEIKVAITSLLLMVTWINDPTDMYSHQAADLHRFVLGFFDPISQSTPHIYISALAFAPNQCVTSQQLLPWFTNILTFAKGKKRHWSACLRTLDGHSDVVRSAIFSKDGKMIASGSEDNTIRIWDVETGTMLVGPLEGHTHWVRSVSFSPDGCYVASGSKDCTVCIWDIKTGTVIKSLKGHNDSIFSVAFSSNAKYVASGSADCTVRIWDIQESVTVKLLKGHMGVVRSVAFSPNGQYVVSGSEDCNICLWDVEKSKMVLQPLKGHCSVVRSVAFSWDGQYIASASDDQTVRIWNAETGAPVLMPLTHTQFVFSVAFSPNGRHIVSGGGDQTICIWDTESGILIDEPFVGHNGHVWSAVFSPNGHYVVSGSSDKTIRVWDVTVGTATDPPQECHKGTVWSVAISPDGKYIASSGNDKTIRMWDTKTGTMVGQCLDGHRDVVCSVSFSSHGAQLASGSRDKTICIWDINTYTMVARPLEGHKSGVLCVTFSSANTLLASGSFDKTIHIWDGKTGAPIKVLVGHRAAVRSVSFSPNSQLLASSSDDKTICTWDINTGVTIEVFNRHDSGVNSVAFSPNGHHLVSGSSDKTVRIWDLWTNTSVILPDGHNREVFSVAFSLDGCQVMSGSRDCTIHIWEVDGCKLAMEPLEGHTNAIQSVAFLPDNRVVSGSSDKTIRIWMLDNIDSTITSMLKGPKISLLDSTVACDIPVHGKPVISRMVVPTTDTSVQFMDDCGWVTQSGNILLWVPADYRQQFIEPSMIIPTNHKISFDYDKFSHGLSWINVYN